jgi:threonine dehydrogenase-like Zn-dependent dehydrogenase
MRGVIFFGERKLQVAEFPDPAPGAHDVVVEIKASGMCGSDLKFYRATGGETAALGLGKLEGPVIAGHEPCGVVVNVGGAHTIAIIGQGPVGLSATQLAAGMGARVIALDISTERLARAKAFGADALINPKTDDALAAMKALTRGLGADLALDTSGAPEGRLTAVRSTRAWGTVCFVGEGGGVSLDVSRDMLRKQLTIIGSWTFSTTGQAECARFVADRNIAVDHLFTHRWGLSQADEAYRLFDRQTSGKAVFVKS